MGSNDRLRPPDVPPPPAQKAPDAAAQATWHARNEATMTRRPEKMPETRPQVPEQKADQRGDRPRPPVDAAQQRAVRPDSGSAPTDKGHLATDYRDWRANLRVVHETKDVNQFRTDGHVNLPQMQADFAKEVKKLADQRKASGSPGAVLVDVRLKNVGIGKNSEAQAIQKALSQVGRKEGVLVRVSVLSPDGGLRTPGGERLIPPPVRKPDPTVLTRPTGPVVPQPPTKPQPPQAPGPPRPPTVPTPPPTYRPPTHFHHG